MKLQSAPRGFFLICFAPRGALSFIRGFFNFIWFKDVCMNEETQTLKTIKGEENEKTNFGIGNDRFE